MYLEYDLKVLNQRLQHLIVLALEGLVPLFFHIDQSLSSVVIDWSVSVALLV